MKFGKEIQRRQLDLPEYAANFVDYKSLKKLIKKLGGGSGSDPAASVPSAAALQANKDRFFFQVERALDKVNSLYLQKEAELKIRLTYLLNRRRALSQSRPPGPASATASAQYIALEDGLEQFVRDLGKLQQFVQVNQTAFSKILKKWDKTSKTQQRVLFLTRAVEIQPCFNREVIAALSDQASACLHDLSERALHDGASADPLVAAPGSTLPTASSRIVTSVERSEDDTIESRILHGAGSGDSDVLQEWLQKIHALPDAGRRVSRVFLSTAEDAPESALALLSHSGLVDVSHTDELTGQNILHKAAIAGRPFLVDFCLASASAPIDGLAVDAYGRTPVHYAAMNGHVDVLDRLVRHAPRSVDAVDHDNFSPLIHAIVNKRTEALQTLLSLGASVDRRGAEDHVPLNVACQHGLVDMVEVLLRYQPQLVPDGQGLYAQHVAARSGSAPLIRMLRRYGADFSLLDLLNGWTPLMHAASEGQVEPVRVLLDECGVDGDTRDEKGYSALHYAVWEGHAECTRILAGRVGRTALKRVPSGGPTAGHRSGAREPTPGFVPSASLPDLASLADVESSFDPLPPPPPLPTLQPLHSAPTLMPTSLPNAMPDIPEISLPPPIMPLRRYGHNFLDRRTFVVLSLGNLGHDAVVLHQPHRHPSSRLTVSARSADLVPRSLPVPVPDDCRVMSFQIDDLSAFALDFDVYPVCGARLIARAVAGSAVFAASSSSVGAGHVELLDHRLRSVGRVSFRFQLIYPFAGVPLELTHFATYWKQTADGGSGAVALSSLSSVLGRGSGGGVGGGNGGAGGSNHGLVSTVSSPRPVVPPRVTGSSLSGEFVRLDVRITADGIPVVHPSPYVLFHRHRFFVATLTFAQFAELGQEIRADADADSDMVDVDPSPSTSSMGRRHPTALARACRSTDPLAIRLGLRHAHASLAQVLDALPSEVSVECHILVDDGRYQTSTRQKWNRSGGSGGGCTGGVCSSSGATPSQPASKPPTTDRTAGGGNGGAQPEQSVTELAAAAAPHLVTTDINLLADAVLAVVFDHTRAVRRGLDTKQERNESSTSSSAAATGRKGGDHSGGSIVVSSFDPDVCLALNWKQPNYPVLLCNAFSPPPLSNAGLSSSSTVTTAAAAAAPDSTVQIQPGTRGPATTTTTTTAVFTPSSMSPTSPWTGSLSEAVMLARTNNFMGIVCSARLLKLAPSLVRSIKTAGLVLIADAGKLVDDNDDDDDDNDDGDGVGGSMGSGMTMRTTPYERLRLLRLQQEKLLEPLLVPACAPGMRIDGSFLANGVLKFSQEVVHL